MKFNGTCLILAYVNAVKLPSRTSTMIDDSEKVWLQVNVIEMKYMFSVSNKLELCS